MLMVLARLRELGWGIELWQPEDMPGRWAWGILRDDDGVITAIPEESYTEFEDTITMAVAQAARAALEAERSDG